MNEETVVGRSFVRIDITQDHIDRGVKGRSRECPVSLGITEHLLPGCEAVVGASGAWFGIVDADSEEMADLCGFINFPPEVTDFIIAFDNGKKVAPISFDLPL